MILNSDGLRFRRSLEHIRKSSRNNVNNDNMNENDQDGDYNYVDHYNGNEHLSQDEKLETYFQNEQYVT